MRRVIPLLAVAFFAFSASAEARTARIYFTQGEQLAHVTRHLPPGVRPALSALMAGPPVGYGTRIPNGVTATVRGRRIDFTPDLTVHAALAQVVFTTATGGRPVTIDGTAYTRADFGAEPYRAPRPPALKVPAPADPTAVQSRLAALGYLPAAAVTGSFDYLTMQAVLAFQGWTGLQRDGIAGPQTLARLRTAGRPVPLARTSRGKRVEIHRARGVVLLVRDGTVVRAIHTSTGIGGDSTSIGTPPGTWRIYRKEVRSWSVPYKTWLPYASYWNGGWALHGYADVPPRPASHGCARLPLAEARFVYEFATVGTPVQVI
jgi:hypothetical protein